MRDMRPLCFACNVTLLLVVSPAGGLAEGNSHQLPVSGGWFPTGLIMNSAESIKGHILTNSGRERGVGGGERKSLERLRS